MNRNGKDEPLPAYLTDVLGQEAAAYIQKSSAKPWFLYLAFNAPHTPLQVTEKHLSRVGHITDETRRNYAGLVVGMDDALGAVMKALRDSGQEQNTLVWFFSDNGGPVGVTHSDNTPLRGAKGQVFEGGVRVPFLISWPSKLVGGKDFAPPVHTLDVFATAVALTGAKVPATHQLEGVDLMPHLTGAKSGAPHERLFWRAGGGARSAVREGDWKLVQGESAKAQLFNLAMDIGETKDLAAEQPAVLARLTQAYSEWDRRNIAPLFESPNAGKAKAAKKAK